MKKGTIQADIAETLLELGKSTATQSAKAVNQTFNPVKLTETLTTSENSQPAAVEKIKASGEGSSKLDLNGLNEKYAKQDTENLSAMRHRLFKLVKEGEGKAIAERKQENENRKKHELEDVQEKKRKQEQESQVLPGVPKGKERKSIFAIHKKKADLSHVETKPSVSKG